MPGSLVIGHDAFSDLSDGKSLDSKIGIKKVSFNNAVRVNKYPWRPESEISEHSTLPRNRFWFKVYQNKQDTSYTGYKEESTAWNDKKMECIHDSLAPIAEVENQDTDRSNSLVIERNINPCKVNNERNFNNSYCFRPTDPPVDYLDDMSTPSPIFNEVKHVCGRNELNNDRFNNNSNQWNNSFNCKFKGGLGGHPEVIIENDEHFTDSFRSRPVEHNSRLPIYSFQNDTPTRRLIGNLDTTNNLMLRERRSRSQDDHIDDDNKFKHLGKADKSVSTEDLNFDNKPIIPTNRFLKSSRDIATQCYGTSNQNKILSKLDNANISPSSQTESCFCNTERLKNFKSMTFKLNARNEQNKSSIINPKKDCTLEKFSRPKNILRGNNVSTSTVQNLRFFNDNSHLSEKSNKLKPLALTKNSISNISHTIANKTCNKSNFKRASNPVFISTSDIGKNPKNTCLNKDIRDTVGYRQIPLHEGNANANRKPLNINNNETSQNSCKTGVSMPPNQILKSIEQISNVNQSKKFLPNNSRRSFRTANNHSSPYKEGSLIDWSLSGFQLARKPENGITSISDGEYTVHRRAPLLMYIPGVSHHDRPAIKDDGLLALNDLSRPELNNSLSSLFSVTSVKDNNAVGGFRRRQSMREGKSKWLKWKPN